MFVSLVFGLITGMKNSIIWSAFNAVQLIGFTRVLAISLPNNLATFLSFLSLSTSFQFVN